MLQLGCRDRHVEIHAPHSAVRCPTAPCARTAGSRTGRSRNAAWMHGLTFAPDPATHNHCTIGGMIGNNSCGVHSLMGGRTLENVEELEILTYDGLRMRVGATSEAELESIVQRGGRRGEIYAGL